MIQYPLNYSYNPYYRHNIYADYLNAKMQASANEFYKNYYNDLDFDEINLSMENRNKLLYSRGKLEQLSKYGTYTDCSGTFGRVKKNKDFQELVKSKYLNNANDFVRFINDLKTLEDKRAENLKYFYPPYGVNVSVYRKPIDYAKYDMKDYLRMLNDFSKNDKISDDLKRYYLLTKTGKIDLYYTKLDRINNSQNPVEVLAEKIVYVDE